MTAKEMAKDLVNKYDSFQDVIEGFNFYDSKVCALMAVDLAIDAIYGVIEDDYWENVKQEIYKL